MMYGIIYKLTSPSLKVYIGQTVDFDRRMAFYAGGHCKGQRHLHSAILKYGWYNFKKEVLCPSYSQSELDQLEIDAIKDHQAANPSYGYNLSLGGVGGGKRNAETKARCHLAQLGNKKRLGRKHLASTKAKMSSVQFGAKHSRALRVICLDTGTVYACTHEAERETGVDHSSIIRCCKGIHKSAGKLRWKYADKETK
jgi:group I intron endonuclease